MNSAIERRNEKLGNKVVKALKQRHFDAYFCKDKQQAQNTAISLIPKDDVISWGGSASIVEIGLIDKLYELGFKVLDRDSAKTLDERTDIMRQALLCDTFLTSSNAISENGHLVNIDGVGNRTAAMIYGPKSVIVIAGINKVVKSLSDAYIRARTVAAPINIQRYPQLNTPCLSDGSCDSCKSEGSICSYIVTTRLCRPRGRIKVIITGENLGF